jgi:hypothetical protein
MRQPVQAALFAALMLNAAPAGAETAMDVWQSWRDAAAALEGTLSAREEASPGRLVLRDVTFVTDTEVRLVFSRIELAEAADGSVTITLPPQAELVLDPPNSTEPGKADRVVFAVAMPDFAAKVTGFGRDLAYSVTAPSVSVVLDRVEPALPQGSVLELTLAVADLGLDWAQGARDGGEFAESRVDLGTLHGDLRVDLPDGVRGDMAIDLSGFSAGLSAFLPRSALGAEPMEADALVAMLGDGFAIDTSLRFASLSLFADVEDQVQAPVLFSTDIADGEARVAMDRTAMAYSAGLGKGGLHVKGDFPDEPVDEVEFGWNALRSRMSMGLNDLRGPQDWSALLRLDQVTLSETIWNEADPGQALPRDPASVVIDLSGIYALDPAVLEPGRKQKPGEDLPLTAFSLDLNELLVAGLGLNLTGTGGLEFDFTDLVTFAGTPAPVGRMDFVTRGANALIDRLVAAGLVPEGEASSMRFGLMFIGRAGAEPDTLETSIEFRDKAFYLNGQKIR